MGSPSVDAEIRWTTHGVAHVEAADLYSAGFGQGFACASDRMPSIADHVLKVRSQRARVLGPGADNRHVDSDFGYLSLGIRQRARALAEAQGPETAALAAGYLDGINAYLDEADRASFPAWCRDWIGKLDTEDIYSIFVDLCLMGSGRNLVGYIGSAEPAAPAPGGPIGPEPPPGSNGWALGSEATGGPGMVMANPHFPWYGEGKLFECHLRVPGTLDAYGVSLVGAPGIHIGFNRHLAWTHTFSRGHRFCVQSLELDPADPTRYRYGDDYRQMTSQTHSIEVLDSNGEISVLSRDLHSSHYGPMLNLPILGWSAQMGFTFADANRDNDWFMAQVLAIDMASDIDELAAAFERHGGLPWVNTLAADSSGRCWYIDSSPTPNLSAEAARRFEERVATDPLTQIMLSQRVALLNGSDPADELITEPDSPAPGLVPFGRLPRLERRDHVFNANDGYWLANAEAILPEASPLHGLYRRPVSPRTRMCGLSLAGRGPRRPAGTSVTAADLEAMVMGNESLTAHQLADAVAERLAEAGQVDIDGAVVDLTAAAEVLRSWDRTFGVGARGAVLWRELLAGFSDEELRGETGRGTLWAELWDPDRPLDTPSGLAPAAEDLTSDPVVLAAARAVGVLRAAGVAPDAALGDVQWADRDRRVPVSGGWEPEGVLNVAAPLGALARCDVDPEPQMPPAVPGRFERTGLSEGGYPITYGTSFVMVAEMGPDGPRARGLLVYGQSDLPGSPHRHDQLEAFAAGELRPLLFTESEIAAAEIQRRSLSR